MGLNATIFIMFFANSLPVFFASQLLEGIPWGIFIANAPAYCSEIVPMRLRAPATQVLSFFWAVGAVIVGAVTFFYNPRLDTSAYRFVPIFFPFQADSFRIPTALQWMFPTPLAVLMFIAPESPWWLTRKGRYDQAARSVERLGRRSLVNSTEAVAMMRRVIDAESESAPRLIELFKKTDLRRTAIVCGIYASQNLAGNLIANQAVFFFERKRFPFSQCSSSSSPFISLDKQLMRQRRAWKPIRLSPLGWPLRVSKPFSAVCLGALRATLVDDPSTSGVPSSMSSCSSLSV